jgi:MscS family membrane protein
MGMHNLRSSITFLMLAMLLALGAGCARSDSALPTATVSLVAPTTTIRPSLSPPTATAPAESGSDVLGLATLAQVVPTRTPEPTVTPDALDQAVDEIVQNTGLAGKTLLGLSVEDWFNLGLSLVIVLTAYLIGSWTIHWLLPRLVSRTKTDLDERLLQVSGNELRWLVVVLFLRFATNRLDFINADLKTFLGDIYFLVILLLAILVMFRFSNLIAQTAQNRAKQMGQQKEAESLITLVVWGFRSFVIIIAISLLLNHFGIDITGFAVMLGIIGLAISFAGRDVLADIIAGAMILIDRPYRVGDRVGLGTIDFWGDVVDIGMLSTKVLTLDNRMVIVPNSKARQDQIINYSYPDPSYYDITDIGVAFDNDVEQVEQLLKNAAGSIDGVEKEQGIDSRLESFTRDEMIFRVGWWMKDNEDYYKLRQLVNRAIVQTFKESGVIFPYQKEQVEMETNSDRSEISEKLNQDQ